MDLSEAETHKLSLAMETSKLLLNALLSQLFDSFKLFSEFDFSQLREGAKHSQREFRRIFSLFPLVRVTGRFVQREQFLPQIDGNNNILHVPLFIWQVLNR